MDHHFGCSCYTRCHHCTHLSSPELCDLLHVFWPWMSVIPTVLVRAFEGTHWYRSCSSGCDEWDHESTWIQDSEPQDCFHVLNARGFAFWASLGNVPPCKILIPLPRFEPLWVHSPFVCFRDMRTSFLFMSTRQRRVLHILATTLLVEIFTVTRWIFQLVSCKKFWLVVTIYDDIWCRLLGVRYRWLMLKEGF